MLWWITIEVKEPLPPRKTVQYLGVTTMTLWRWVREQKIMPGMLDHTYVHINELNRVKAVRAGETKGDSEIDGAATLCDQGIGTSGGI